MCNSHQDEPADSARAAGSCQKHDNITLASLFWLAHLLCRVFVQNGIYVDKVEFIAHDYMKLKHLIAQVFTGVIYLV